MNLRKRNKHRKGPEERQKGREKKGIRTKTQDGQAEVFVLPPDLLQKLGIDLGSVQSSSVCPTNTKSKTGDINSNHVPDISHDGKEPDNTPEPPKEKIQRDTILETADLMKKSVFLSPTFVTAENIVPGELEISNVIGKEEATQTVVADNMPTHVAIDEHVPHNVTESTQEITTVSSNKKSFIDYNDIETRLCDTIVALETQVLVDKPLPQIEKMSVVVNVERQDFTMGINNEQSSLNPDIGKETLNSLDGNSTSFSTQEMTVSSNSTTNVAETREIKIALHKIGVNDTTHVNELSAIGNTICTTDIGYKHSTSNPYSNIEIINSSDENLISVNNYAVTEMPEKCTRGKSTDDHSDEAYLSDCSNRTISPTDTTGCLPNIPNKYSFKMPTESQNKVKILSEEILSPSKLKDIQIMLSPNRTSFIPISINCILERNKGEITQNYTKAVDNVIDTFGYENKDIDLLALYDEHGNRLPVIKNNNNFDIITDVKIEDLSQSTEETITEPDTASETHAPENHTFGDIDLAVIGMDIAENEDILENFVHEITSNDDNNILKKIEQSENYCSPVKIHKSVVPQKVTCTRFEHAQVQKKNYELNKLTVESNATDILFKKLNQSNEVSQVLDMVTNINQNMVKEDSDVKNREDDDVHTNKNLNFETDITIESNVTKINTLDGFSHILNNTEEDETDLDINEINPIPLESHISEEQNDSPKKFEPKTTEKEHTDKGDKAKRIVSEKERTGKLEFSSEHIHKDVETIDKSEEIVPEQGNVEKTDKTKEITSERKHVVKIGNSDKIASEQGHAKKIDIDNVTIADKEQTEKVDHINKFISEKEHIERVDKDKGTASELECIEKIYKTKEIVTEPGYIEKIDNSKEMVPKQALVERIGMGKETASDKKHIAKIDKKKQVKQIDKSKEIASEQKHVIKIDESYEIGSEQGHVENVDKSKIETASEKVHTEKVDHIKEIATDKDYKEKIDKGKGTASKKLNTEKLDHIKDMASNKEHIENIEKGKEIAPADVDTENVEKIIEIATYLCQFAKIRSEARILKRKSIANIKIPGKRSKHNALTSKKYIQGVEKPGGSENPDEDFKVNKVEKTYARVTKSSKRSFSRPLLATPAKKSQNITTSCYDLEKSNNLIQESHKNPEFCLCGDFGILAYYDSNYPYEHIHFWEHKVSDCDLESLFSIFNESDESAVTVDSKIEESVEFSEECEQNSITHVDSICWHSCKRVIPNHREEIISAIKNTTTTKDTIEPISNDDNTTMAAESDLQAGSFSIAVSKQSELLDLDTSKEPSSPHVEKDLDPVLKDKNIKNASSEESPNTSTASKPTTTKGIVKDTKTLKEPKLKEKQSQKVKTAGSFESIKVKMESKETEKDTNELRPIGRVSVRSIDKLIFEDDANSEQKTDHVVSGIENTQEKNTAIERQTRKKSKKKVRDEDEPVNKKSVKCDVCKRVLSEAEWESHIADEHCYIAWKSGSSFDLENKEDILLEKLLQRIKTVGFLKCGFCGTERTKPKSFLKHVKQKHFPKLQDSSDAITMEVKSDETAHDISQPDNKDNSVEITVTENASSGDMWVCGVCDKAVIPAAWMEHIQIHDYLAWRVGDTPLNLDNEDNVRIHFNNLTKMFGDLKCSNCGKSFRYPKPFIDHKQKCTRKKKSKKEKSFDDIPLADLKRKKRKLDDDDKEDVKTKVECGVCKETVAEAAWIDHICQNHEYLAWKSGDPPLDLNDEEQVRAHLFEMVRITGGLKCSKCDIVRKYPKSYMVHVQQCTGKDVNQDESLNTTVEIIPRNPNDQVKCAVCEKFMLEKDWHQHIFDEHQYMAWRDGDPPLNMEDPEAVKNHLYNICKQTGNLTCNKCGLERKYVKVYLHHIESCTGPPPEPEVNNESVALVKEEINYLDVVDQDVLVTCAVCHKEVSSAKWIQHIGRAHNYMAHHTGQTIDLNDQEVVHNYLYEILQKAGHLTCTKCGLLRKYVKTFIQHINTCNVESTMSGNQSDREVQETDGKLICAVCSEEMTPKKWKTHKMEKHYNIAWTVGSVPVDIKNPNVVDLLMKEYVEKYKKMICKVCKATRVSRIGFYAHVIQCGKTEEEIDAQKTTCKVCNKKYLYVYHNQHMTWHNQQELNVQKKLKLAEEQAKKVKEEEAARTVTDDGTPGRRKAAQKAKNVIENLKTENFTIKCPNCKFGGDSKEELLNHVCKGKEEEEHFSDSGESAKIDDYSAGEENEESDDDLVDSDVSNEDLDGDSKRKKRNKSGLAYNHIKRFPFVPKDLNLFLKKAGSEFLRHHHSDDILFPNLRAFDCEPIPSDELPKYLPPLEQSCKFKFGNEDWNTYTRFQVEKKNFLNSKLVSMPYQSIFAGGYIQCVAWSPLSPDKSNVGGNVLAVACHQGPDIMRSEKHETPAGPGLIQLWNFGDFTQKVELSLGIAHDYGAAWAMDWCPYGARDPFPVEGAAGDMLRLGLLAVAFSSGTVAVFAIPYPDCLAKRDKVIQKLKPVAELRQTMNPERQIYQATSICWSKQKPYESIVVGYGDGTTAYFDLNTESPFLKTAEKDVIVMYPYHDERVLNKCITGLDLYPSMDGMGPGGAACFSSGTGVVLKARPGVRPAQQYVSSAIAGTKFEPLWPSAVLVGDEGNLPTAVNEIEWYSGGRRMGGGSAGAGCQRCGRFVFAASPLLILRCPHPADNSAGKQVAAILGMTPFGKKRKKLANDELQTIIEPTTYDDAVRQYGIELRMDRESLAQAAKQPRETYPERCPERFPLGDITSMAFCPDPAHHKKLAVATHAGIIFLIQI